MINEFVVSYYSPPLKLFAVAKAYYQMLLICNMQTYEVKTILAF